MKIFRWLLALVCVGISAVCVWKAFDEKSRIPAPEQIPAIRYQDLVKAAIDSNIAQSSGLFDVGLLLLGALWALVIAKKDEGQVTFGDVPEMSMLVAASALLLLSFVWHEYYLENLGNAYDLAAHNCSDKASLCFPDVLSIPNIEYLRKYQEIFLLLGGGVALVTIVSAHQFKR